MNDDKGQRPHSLTQEDQAEPDMLRDRAHEWHDATFRAISQAAASPGTVAEYREALANLAELVKALADKYPGNEAVSMTLTQIEAWLAE